MAINARHRALLGEALLHLDEAAAAGDDLIAAEALRQGQQAQAVAELERARQRLAETAAAAPASPYSGELRARAARMQSAGEAAGAAASPAAQRSMSYDFADEAAEAEGY